MKKFEFRKSYEEIEIAGKIYRIDFTDEKVMEYQKNFSRFYQEAQELNNLDIESLSDEEQQTIISKQRKNMKIVTENLLGEGTFEELFELSGRSTVNYMELLLFLGEVMSERTNTIKEDARKKYVKKKK
ncbi:hypothetical protein B6A27_00385 [Anoxybacillus sp. UARK-01]|uniref:hypothetical protein n=1 Tax=Anoxybacillus sp. UARK-01 TaxID=1895648 RepID=UPI0009BB520A|nr:hypothetical protein [Anoxybacillus sp. UARK-01]OQM47536.1 hypothetical protein B6A27_00385 [Anoxybacillus sp. UARK-01]